MIYIQKFITAFLAIFLLLFTCFISAKEPIRVVASIKPLQLIVATITNGVTQVDVLLPPGISPHSYHLKPSDARKLQVADIIFWIGPEIEIFLKKMLTSSKSIVSVPLMEQTLKLAKNSLNKKETHHDNDIYTYYSVEDDAHIWLSPINAIAIANSIAEKMSYLDPHNEKIYKENLRVFKVTMQDADKKNKIKLTKFHKQPIFVFHNAFGYLQGHYNLNIIDHFTINPEQQPGAKHLTRLRIKIKQAGKSCILREPQFQPDYIERITQGIDAKIATLDLLATDIAVTPRGYIQFMNGLVDNIIQCLK